MQYPKQSYETRGCSPRWRRYAMADRPGGSMRTRWLGRRSATRRSGAIGSRARWRLCDQSLICFHSSRAQSRVVHHDETHCHLSHDLMSLHCVPRSCCAHQRRTHYSHDRCHCAHSSRPHNLAHCLCHFWVELGVWRLSACCNVKPHLQGLLE